jgi:DNA invertase Pin-like site-specific DNA recombinase
MKKTKYVSYLRVSTDKQGKSGLGLEAQREAVKTFINGNAKLIAEYVEIESGKRDDRPKLKEALHRARVTGSTLVVAKLDRLSRNVAFLANMQESGVKFVAVDMPEANELTIHVLAAVAQHERQAISARTKAAMAAAKRRKGHKGFGHKTLPKWLEGIGNDDAVAAIRAKAADFAKDVLVVIEDIRASGHTTLQAIADELNEREITTARGGQWHPMTVRNVLQRSEG